MGRSAGCGPSLGLDSWTGWSLSYSVHSGGLLLSSVLGDYFGQAKAVILSLIQRLARLHNSWIRARIGFRQLAFSGPRIGAAATRVDWNQICCLFPGLFLFGQLKQNPVPDTATGSPRLKCIKAAQSWIRAGIRSGGTVPDCTLDSLDT